MYNKVKQKIVCGNIHRESKYILMEHWSRQLTLWYVDQYLSTRIKILFEKSYIHRPKLLFFKYIFLFTMWQYFFHLETHLYKRMTLTEGARYLISKGKYMLAQEINASIRYFCNFFLYRVLILETLWILILWYCY